MGRRAKPGLRVQALVEQGAVDAKQPNLRGLTLKQFGLDLLEPHLQALKDVLGNVPRKDLEKMRPEDLAFIVVSICLLADRRRTHPDARAITVNARDIPGAWPRKLLLRH